MSQALQAAYGLSTELRRSEDFPSTAARLAQQLGTTGVNLASVSVYLLDGLGATHYFVHPPPVGSEPVALESDPLAVEAAATGVTQSQEGAGWRLAVPTPRGVVCLTGPDGKAPDADQQQQLTQLAGSVSLLCVRHQDLRELETQVLRVEASDESLLALYDGSYDLSGRDQRQVATRIIDLVRSTLHLDRVGLFLRQGDDLRGAWGMDEDRGIVSIAGTVFALFPDNPNELSEAAQIARGDLAYFLTQDLDGEGRHSIEGDIHANVSVPMRVGTRIIGVLTADTYYRPRPLNPDILRPLMVLANQGAAALENARLYTEVQVAREDLERRVEQRTAELSQVNQDKELLLKEVYHRTKNNLQLVASILNLQAGQVDDERALKALEDCVNRVHAMATIHEELYGAADLRAIDFARHLHSLVSELFRSYQVQPGSIKLVLDADYVLCGLDVAIPLSLIINELVTNSLKYAFPGQRSGVLEVTLRIDGDDATLRVQDDGIGLPTDLDPDNSATLGLQLVSALAGQLGGQLEVRREASGVGFHIRLPGLVAKTGSAETRAHQTPLA